MHVVILHTQVLLSVYILYLWSVRMYVYMSYKVIFDVLERHCLIQGKGLEFTAHEYPLRVP